jgi:hypothetical protein
MSTNTTLLEQFKAHVTEASSNPTFIHHDWFVELHLNFVEKISFELCDIYKEADRDIVMALVWVHDYGKILNKEKEHDEEMFQKGRDKLLEIGLAADFVNKVIDYLSILEKKMEIDLHEAPIEVRIVSSADAASHLVGPFWSIYFKENGNKTIAELMESNRKKLKKDWERKVVLPEIKTAFKARHDFVWEQSGNFPDRFLG